MAKPVTPEVSAMTNSKLGGISNFGTLIVRSMFNDKLLAAAMVSAAFGSSKPELLGNGPLWRPRTDISSKHHMDYSLLSPLAFASG